MPSTNGHGSKPERVALYFRVSSLEQRDVGTIETQRQYLERYTADRELEVADSYADDGVPGTIPFHERAEGRRLLEDAKAGKFQSVVCYKLDRVGRSLLNVVDAHDRLEVLGVGLRSAKEQLETTTPAGRLQFQMARWLRGVRACHDKGAHAGRLAPGAQGGQAARPGAIRLSDRRRVGKLRGSRGRGAYHRPDIHQHRGGLDDLPRG